MAFHGDLSSYPLPELLQWLDTSRKTGALHLTWGTGSRKIFLLGGQVVATSAPGIWERLARVLEHGAEASGEKVMGVLRTGEVAERGLAISVRQLAEEDLLGVLADLTQAQGGHFHWTEDPDRGEDEWVELELPLRHALFESLRRMDEGPDVERVLSADTLVVRGKRGPTPSNVLQRVLLHQVTRDDGIALGRLCLSLGLARSVVLRAVYELLRADRVTVEGAGEVADDPIADMLEKGAVLLRERQFDAAALVFTSLLQNDPTDRRVREFAHMVEREHAAALYRELPPFTRFDVSGDPSVRSLLRPEERQLVTQLETGWDVSAAVLASPHRELETLKTLLKLVRSGAVAPRPEGDEPTDT